MEEQGAFDIPRSLIYPTYIDRIGIKILYEIKPNLKFCIEYFKKDGRNVKFSGKNRVLTNEF